MVNQNNILKKLKKYGKSGSYKEALKAYLSHKKNNTLNDLLIDIQFAVALQHAGLYNLALDTYLEVKNFCKENKTLFESSDISFGDLSYNLSLQEAVLQERLYNVDEAIYILDKLNKIKKPQDVRDIEIAFASIETWYYITRFKCHMYKKQFKKVTKFIEECASTKDKLLRGWIDTFRELVKINTTIEPSEKNFENLYKIIERIGKVDPPGQPWLYLVAGQYLFNNFQKESINFFKEASKTASCLGKYYIFATSNEFLAKYYKKQEKHLFERTFFQSINSYAKCHLLLRKPFRNQLYDLAMNSEKLRENDFFNLFISNAGFVRDRKEIKFYEMCEHFAKQKNKKNWEIFEEFVSDWASFNFFGKKMSEPAGLPTADTIIVREVSGEKKGTIVQAKHHKNPKKSIPNRLHLRKLAKDYNIKIEKYVFVISTSNNKGWNSSSWHYQDEDKIRELVSDSDIEVIIVTEPELQTDVVLNDQLFFKYFKYLLPSVE